MCACDGRGVSDDRRADVEERQRDGQLLKQQGQGRGKAGSEADTGGASEGGPTTFFMSF